MKNPTRRQFNKLKSRAPRSASSLTPLISVVLPVYNQSSFLSGAIESVLAAAENELELIVVDDGSETSLDSALLPFSEKNNVRIVRQEHAGLPAALNLGFSLARGTYLSWTSADNLYNEGALTQLRNYLSANPQTDLVYANMSLIDEAGAPYPVRDYRPEDVSNQDPSLLLSPFDQELLGWRNNNFIGACFLFHRRVIDLIGDHKTSLMGVEDFDFWLRASEVFNFDHIDTDEALYQYRIHASTITESIGKYQIEAKAEALVSEHKATRRPIRAIAQSSWEMDRFKISGFQESRPLTKSHASFLEGGAFSLYWIVNADKTKGELRCSPLTFPRQIRAARYSNFRAVVATDNSQSKLASFVPSGINSQFWEESLLAVLDRANITLALLCCNTAERDLANKLFLESPHKDKLRIVDISHQTLVNGLHSEESYNSLTYVLSSIDGLLFSKSETLSMGDLMELYLESNLAALAGLPIFAITQPPCESSLPPSEFAVDRSIVGVFDLWCRLLPLPHLQVIRSAQDDCLSLLENPELPDQSSLEQLIETSSKSAFYQRVQQVAVAKSHSAS